MKCIPLPTSSRDRREPAVLFPWVLPAVTASPYGKALASSGAAVIYGRTPLVNKRPLGHSAAATYISHLIFTVRSEPLLEGLCEVTPTIFVLIIICYYYIYYCAIWLFNKTRMFSKVLLDLPFYLVIIVNS